MTLPATLIVIRHGKSEINDQLAHTLEEARTLPLDLDTRLTHRGVKQAELVGAFIRERFAIFKKCESIPRGYHLLVSPLKRAMETAQHLGLPHAEWTVDNRLRERDYGGLYGMAEELVEQVDPDFNRWRKRDPLNARQPKGGESLSDIAEIRIPRLMESVPENSTILCVTHGDVMYAFLAYALKLDPHTFLRFYTPPHFGFGDILIITRDKINAHLVTDPEPDDVGRPWPPLHWNEWTHLKPLTAPNELKKFPCTRQRFTNEDLRVLVDNDPTLCSPWMATDNAPDND